MSIRIFISFVITTFHYYKYLLLHLSIITILCYYLYSLLYIITRIFVITHNNHLWIVYAFFTYSRAVAFFFVLVYYVFLVDWFAADVTVGVEGFGGFFPSHVDFSGFASFFGCVAVAAEFSVAPFFASWTGVVFFVVLFA